jgi:hypothetical protein
MKMMKQTKAQLLDGRQHGFGKLTFSGDDFDVKMIIHWRIQ